MISLNAILAAFANISKESRRYVEKYAKWLGAELVVLQNISKESRRSISFNNEIASLNTM